jgi:hypothetical protein
MERCKFVWMQLTMTRKFFLLVVIHLIINIITSITFFLDDFSLANQIVHSIIHIIFFWLLIKLIYLPTQREMLKRENEKWWILAFIILNAIPFFQSFEFADNGFVPIWDTAPQIKFGIPKTYIRWFSTNFQDFKGIEKNSLIHINNFFLNLYLLGLLQPPEKSD